MSSGASEYGFTVIVPVYNESGNLSRLEEALSAFLEHCCMKSAVLFVDDGSDDGSLSGLKDICARHEDFHYISFSRNCGLSAALKAGFDCVRSPYVGYMDADMQTDPEDFSLLLPYLKDYDMVTGVRARRDDSFFRRFQSKAANAFRRFMTGDGASDTCCPLKVFRTETARGFPMFKGMHRFFPALVLLRQGASYKEVPVKHRKRMSGTSKFGLRNRMMSSFADCLAFRWMKSRYIDYSIRESDLPGHAGSRT